MDKRPVTLGIDRLHPELSEKNELPMNSSTNPGKIQGDQDVVMPMDNPLTPEEIDQLRDRIVTALYTVFDPEIPVNIYELGLVYDIYIKPDGDVNLRMTLTSPACPVAGSLPGEVERKLRSVEKVTRAKVDVVWDPPWDKSRMTEAAKLQLGIDD